MVETSTPDTMQDAALGTILVTIVMTLERAASSALIWRGKVIACCMPIPVRWRWIWPGPSGRMRSRSILPRCRQQDGWTVLRQFKADDDLRSIPVIMVSVTGDRGLGFSLGAAAMLNKPVDRGELAATIHAQIAAGAQDQDAARSWS